MASYEYRCVKCGDRFTAEMRGLDGFTACASFPEDGGDPDLGGLCGGKIKRVWSCAIVWPKSERGH